MFTVFVSPSHNVHLFCANLRTESMVVLPPPLPKIYYTCFPVAILLSTTQQTQRIFASANLLQTYYGETSVVDFAI